MDLNIALRHDRWYKSCLAKAEGNTLVSPYVSCCHHYCHPLRVVIFPEDSKKFMHIISSYPSYDRIIWSLVLVT